MEQLPKWKIKSLSKVKKNYITIYKCVNIKEKLIYLIRKKKHNRSSSNNLSDVTWSFTTRHVHKKFKRACKDRFTIYLIKEEWEEFPIMLP